MKLIANLVTVYFGLISTLFTGSAQVLYQGSLTKVGTGNTATIGRPVGTNSNEILITGLMLEKGSAVQVTAPAGWTLIRRTDNGTDAGIATYYKIVTITEPANYSFQMSGSPKWSIGISRIAGADQVNPIVASSGSIGDASTVSTQSVTTTQPNQMVLSFFTNKKNATYTPQMGVTEHYDAPNNSGGQPSNMMASYIMGMPGATGAITAISSEPEKWAGQQVAIKAQASGPVDVKLTSFSGEVLNAGVKLSWKTSSEINNAYIAVERSGNGSNFTEIGKVVSTGNFNIGYYLLDENPVPGINYYRLRQVDIDGKATYYNIIQIQFTRQQTTSLHIYPNPSVDILNIERKDPAYPALLRIIDQSGNVIITQNLTAGTLKQVMQLSHLKPGGYTIQLKEKDKTETKKFMKM